MKEDNRKEEKENNFNTQVFLKEYLFPTLSVVVLILLITLIIIPTINNISDNLNLREKRKQELTRLEMFLSNIIEVSYDHSRYLDDNVVLDKYLPQESMLSSFIDDVNLMASTVGLRPTTLKGSEELKEDDVVLEGTQMAVEYNQQVNLNNGEIIDEEYVPTPEQVVEDPKSAKPHRVFASFNYEGKFEDVYKLFQELNNFRGLLSVQSVSFKKESDNWDIEIMVASYNLPQDVLDGVVAYHLVKKDVNLLPNVDEDILLLIRARLEQ